MDLTSLLPNPLFLLSDFRLSDHRVEFPKHNLFYFLSMSVERSIQFRVLHLKIKFVKFFVQLETDEEGYREKNLSNEKLGSI